MLYFILSSDFKLHIYNGNLIRVQEIGLQTSLLTQSCFYDDANLYLAGGIDGVYVFNVKVDMKYSPSLALNLDPMGRLIKIDFEDPFHLHEDIKWVKGLKKDEKNKILIAWSQESLVFWDLAPAYAEQNEKIKSRGL